MEKYMSYKGRDLQPIFYAIIVWGGKYEDD